MSTAVPPTRKTRFPFRDHGPIQEMTTVVGGVRTRALRVQGAGPPVLLLHGYTDSADTWRYVLLGLAQRGRAAIAVDLPGHGAADPHRDTPILPQLARFATALVAQYPGGVLVGNSLGGLAALLAAEDPELPVAGVVGLGPAGLGYQRWLLAVQPVVLPVMLASHALPSSAARLVVGRLYRTVTVGRRPPREALGRYAGHFNDRRRIAALLRMVRWLKTEGMPGCLDLERIDVPVLLLWGRNDWLVPVPDPQALRTGGDLRLEVWEDGGHCLQLEIPERVVDRLVAFSDACVVRAS